MSAIGISTLDEYFHNEHKSINRVENHYNYGHVESFYYADGVLKGSVHASMKEKVYKVTVCIAFNFNIINTGVRPMFCVLKRINSV